MKQQSVLFLPHNIWINPLYITFAKQVECVSAVGEARLPKADAKIHIILLLRVVDICGNRGLAYARDLTNDPQRFLRCFDQFSRGKWDTFECYLIEEDLLEIALKDI